MTTIRITTNNFDTLLVRLKKLRPNDAFEVKRIGLTFREVRTSLTEVAARKACKGLGPVVITEA